MMAYRSNPFVWFAALLTLAACADPEGQAETPKLDILQVLPASGTISVGGTASLGAQRLLGPQSTNLTSTVKWSSDNEAVATVSYTPDDGALVTGVSPGTAHIQAVGGGATGMAEFKVIAEVIALELDKGNFEIAKGTSKQLGATLITSAASKRELESGTWGSTDPNIASVDDTGVVTGVGAGDATITLVSGGLTASQSVHVRDWTLEAITPAAVDGNTLPLGQSTMIRVTGMFSGNHTQNITSLFTLSVDMPKDGSDAPISLSGTSVTAGDAAGMGSLSGAGKAGTAAEGKTFTLTFMAVDAPLTALTLDMPATLSTKGQMLTPTITGTFGPDALMFETSATLSAESEEIVYVDNANGTINALKAGQTTVTASVTLPDKDTDDMNNPVIKTAHDLTVVDDDISAITIALDSDSLEAGAAGMLTATGAFGGVDMEDLTEYVVWSSDDEAVAVVSNVSSGKVTGVAAGTANIKASYGRTTKTFTVSVK